MSSCPIGVCKETWGSRRAQLVLGQAEGEGAKPGKADQSRKWGLPGFLERPSWCC